MSEMNRTPAPQRRQPAPRPAVSEPVAPVNPPKKKKKKGSGTGLRVLRRVLLVFFTFILLLVVGLCMVLNLIFNGPSASARDVLTMSLTEASATKWVPGLFMGDELVAEIRQKVSTELPDEVSDGSQIVINRDTGVDSADSEWADYPDGIRIENITGDTYTAHVMIIRDPSLVYMATSTERFSTEIPGTRINHEIETEGAIAAINAGAFFDNGTSSPVVGSVPMGLVFAGGRCVWDDDTTYDGFVGFNQDDILVVAQSMTKAEGERLGIRDGCCFGPVLVMNGSINEGAYNQNSGYNPRTAIGQRADGAVIFLCVDGRQTSSLGATYADIINIMVEYGAVNACNLDGGSSTVMLYRDTEGRYGEPGQVQMINSYSLLQQEPRKMPTFFMVRPASEG